MPRNFIPHLRCGNKQLFFYVFCLINEVQWVQLGNGALLLYLLNISLPAGVSKGLNIFAHPRSCHSCNLALTDLNPGLAVFFLFFLCIFQFRKLQIHCKRVQCS